MEINHKQLTTVIEKSYTSGMIPIDIKGAPGIGKSESIKDTAIILAEKDNREFLEWNQISYDKKVSLLDSDIAKKVFLYVDIRLSQLDPTDLRGFPKIDSEYAHWVPPLLFKVLANKDIAGILFFDEANMAAPSIQAACYQIINDHQCGELPISKQVLILSAGNRVTDKAAVFDDPAPLRSRRLNFTLNPPNYEEWNEWALDHNVDLRIIGFHAWGGGVDLFKFDSDSKEASFPCPRMWTRLSPLIKDSNNYTLVKTFASGCVGEGTAIKFVSFIKLTEKIDVKTILKNPKLIEKYSGHDQINIKYAILTGICECYAKDKKVLNDALGVAALIEPEYGMFMLKTMKNIHKGNFAKMVSECSNFDKIAEQITRLI